MRFLGALLAFPDSEGRPDAHVGDMSTYADDHTGAATRLSQAAFDPSATGICLEGGTCELSQHASHAAGDALIEPASPDEAMAGTKEFH
jgi:hypothetical protein